MIQDVLSHLSRLFHQAGVAAASEIGVDPSEVPVPEFSRPRQKEHGEWATNVALVLAPKAGRRPREVAEAIAAHLEPNELITSLEVAGPGFLNVFLGASWLHDVVRDIVRLGPDFGRLEPRGEQAQVEFVSANPTGPLHVGHARNAALGDALANVLEAAGYGVEREYYYNDAGRQMEMFGRSVEARLLRLQGHEAEVPEEGYQGRYVEEIARTIADQVEFDPPITERAPDLRWRDVLEHAVPIMLVQIEGTLHRFGIVFDSYFNEKTLHETGAIAQAVERLRRSGNAYDAEGAVWFRSTEFGDDKDRVLIRSGGAPTYFAADCAYLINKFDRGFDHLIYVWGADHHGDVKRVKGAAQALGYDPGSVEMVLYQFVSFLRSGEPVRMSKRTGDLVTLDELLDEVGPDAARYTLLTRSNDSAIDFDIEEVTRQTMDNPVYYVQYAHARIASLLRVAWQQGVALVPWEEAPLDRLASEPELDLIRKLAELPEMLALAAEARSPHRLTRYAEEAAAAFHRFYTDCRIITDDRDLSQARLWLSVAAKQIVSIVLGLLGVSAPEAMERADPVASPGG
jgi:arginyl-tRNA synthetase